MPQQQQQTVFGTSVNLAIDSFPSEAEIQKLEDELPPCHHGWFDSCVDKAKLHYRYWIPPGTVKGVAVFFHGIMSHSGQGLVLDGVELGTTLMSTSFLKEGIALYAFDAYGHGFSEGERFYIPGWKNNFKDCLTFCQLVSKEHPQVPFFLSGESYGGALAILTAKHLQDNPTLVPRMDSILMTAPAIEADLPPLPIYLFLRHVLAPAFPTKTPFFMPLPVSNERIWKNEKVRQHFTNPDYKKMGLDGRGQKMCLGTGLGCVQAIDEANKAIVDLTLPFCIIHGTDDAAVKISGSEYMMKMAKTPKEDKELHPIQGSVHESLADPEVAQASMGHWIAFLKKRLQKTQGRAEGIQRDQHSNP